jgi:hypothetical protein
VTGCHSLTCSYRASLVASRERSKTLYAAPSACSVASGAVWW